MRRIVFVLLSLASLTLCQSALADSFTDSYTSSITYPASSPKFLWVNGDTGTSSFDFQGTIQDTSTGVPPDHAQAICASPLATSVASATVVASQVTSGQAWDSGSVSIDPLANEECQLMLLPQLGSATYSGSLPAPNMDLSGPALLVGEQHRSSAGAGPNHNVVDDYYVAAPQADGFADYKSAGRCGLYDAASFSLTSLQKSPYMFYCNDYFKYLSPSSATRPELLVDGIPAYLPYAAEQMDEDLSLNAGGLPNILYNATPDPATGAVTITETDPVVKCSPQPAVYPPTPASCSSFVLAGVRLDRTISQQAATIAYTTIADTWSATDGNSHTLDMLARNLFQPTSVYASFNWAPSSAGTHQAGDVIPGPTSGTGGVISVEDASAILGSSAATAGAIVLHQSPSRIVWGSPDAFEIGYSATIPAGGNYQQTTDYVWSTSLDEVSTVASSLWDGAQNPTLLFTAPANQATVSSPQLNVTGTAADGVGISSLTVDGKPVGVASDGTWATQVTLNPGANTITAVAANESGQRTTSSIVVTYSPPAPSPAAPGAQCVVPNLLGDTLAQATAALAAGNCALGHVVDLVQRTHIGQIVSQSTPAGWTNLKGTPVNVGLAVAKRVKRHRHHRRH